MYNFLTRLRSLFGFTPITVDAAIAAFTTSMAGLQRAAVEQNKAADKLQKRADWHRAEAQRASLIAFNLAKLIAEDETKFSNETTVEETAS